MAWGVLLFGLLAGCGQRDRPTGPNGTGPITIPLITILTPGADTSVTAGDQVLVSGVITDDTGVDSLYIDIVGGQSSFLPSDVAGKVVPFGFNVTTTGLAGRVIEITIQATDIDGNRSDPTTRTLSVQ